MKRISTLLGVCLTAALVGCASTGNTQVSPGAVDNASACTAKADCGQCPAKASAQQEAVSPGAVGSTKSGCCAKQCPATSAQEGTVSPGAVSGNGCCKKSSSDKT